MSRSAIALLRVTRLGHVTHFVNYDVLRAFLSRSYNMLDEAAGIRQILAVADELVRDITICRACRGTNVLFCSVL